MKLNVDGHDPYETFVVTTWIWYAKDLGPLYVVSLPSSLCFKVWTSLCWALSQHDVPNQWDEPWLNLEERIISLRVRLFENGVIKGRRWIIVRVLLKTRNVFCNLVINHTDPLWVDAKRGVNQQWTKKWVSICPIFDCLPCGVSKTERKSCWWCWGLQDGDCL